MASRLSIIPSPFPPFAGLSNSANARKPFGFGEFGCGVALPNSSRPLSTAPLPKKSKLTPPVASVRSNPFPEISMSMGVSQHSFPVQASKSPPPTSPLQALGSVAQFVGGSQVSV